jgi:hypothetical protein
VPLCGRRSNGLVKVPPKVALPHGTMAAASAAQYGEDVYGGPVPNIEADSPVTCVTMHPSAAVCALTTVSGAVDL